MLQMNLRLAPDDLAYVVEHSGASVVCVDESLLPQAEELASRCPGVRRWVLMSDQGPDEVSTTLPDPVHHETLLERQDTTYDWPVIDETSAYSACYTTGTTGRPKGVFYSHRGIVLHTRSEEHTSELQSLMRISYAVFVLKKKKHNKN